MNRRGFLGSLLGIATGAVLPKPALALLARTESLPDTAFVAAVYDDSAIINLIEMRMAAAAEALRKRIDEDLFKEMTQ